MSEGEAHAPARKRKIVQIAVNNAQLYALCDDGEMFFVADGEGWRPLDVRIVETGTPSFRVGA